MDSGWFGLVLSKSYPTATPMQCSLENLGISWISKHQTYGWKHVSNLRYTEFLAAVPWSWRNLPSSIAVENLPIVKLCKTHIYCNTKWSYFWRDLFFHFHERKNERSGFILLLIGYDGIPLDLHFFFLTFGPQWLPGVLPSNWCVLLFALVIPCAPFLLSNHKDVIVASFLVLILFLGFSSLRSRITVTIILSPKDVWYFRL